MKDHPPLKECIESVVCARSAELGGILPEVIRYGRCDMLDTMHLVGTHERSALVETSRLWAGAAAAAAADATRVEGGARRARRPSR